MTKINPFRRFLLPCFSPAASVSSTTAPNHTTKKRTSTSLRDDAARKSHLQEPAQEEDSSSPESSISSIPIAPPRHSKTMVIGTIFGPRRGHVWFCIQHNRLSTKPSLLLELSMPVNQLVNEMRSNELVRIALECTADAAPELDSCPLRSIPMWKLSCNGRKLGFANKRKAGEHNLLMLKTMQSMTVGAGVIPAGFGSENSEEIMYMRANYEHVIGSADLESFHLINPDDCPGQELSVFLIRSR